MKKLKTTFYSVLRVLAHFLPWLPASKIGKRLLMIVIVAAVAAPMGMYGIARWYMSSASDSPQVLGASFVPSYASHLGVEPKDTLQAMLNDLAIRHLRLVSYWNQIEPSQGQYDFSELDWQFDMAEAYGAEITLSIGLRQPRWPECHPPTWVDTSLPTSKWQPQLEQYMERVIARYKNRPSLKNYQLENEYFLSAFGECQNFDRQRLVDEYNLVKRLDPSRDIIITRSNNGIGIPLGDPTPELYGVSVYKRVWDNKTGRYLEYPQPAWYYAFMAGVQKIVQGVDMNVHELQAEAWAPNGKSLTDISLEEQNKSMNADILRKRFQYGRDTGLQTVDLWGVEYWYHRKVVRNDPSLWQVAKSEFATQ